MNFFNNKILPLIKSLRGEIISNHLKLDPEKADAWLSDLIEDRLWLIFFQFADKNNLPPKMWQYFWAVLSMPNLTYKEIAKFLNDDLHNNEKKITAGNIRKQVSVAKKN